MNLTNLKILARATVPGATKTVIKDNVVELILNQGVLDVAAVTACLKANKKFDVDADISEYNLSSKISDFLVPDKPGLWWYNSDQWDKVHPRTLQWLDERRPDWRDLESDDPEDYTIDGDILTIAPAPNIDITDGFWLYYGKKPVDMTAGTHFPFTGSDTEYPRLSIFDWAIIYYFKWKVKPMLSKSYADEYKRDENGYKAELNEKLALFKRRPDISAEAQYRGPRSRRC